MCFLYTWKKNWELKSFTKEGLFEIVIDVIRKQLDSPEFGSPNLEDDLEEEFEADSVDLIAILLYLEEIFKNASPVTRTVVPTDRLDEIERIEDIFDIIYEVLLDIEQKMITFVPIQPDFESLAKKKKVGQLYHEQPNSKTPNL